MRTKHFAFALIVAAVAAGCVRYTIVPPAIDLTTLGTVGLVTLKATNVKGDLDTAATQFFLQEVIAAQRVPVVELGPQDVVLADIGKTVFDRDAALAIGEKQGVEAFFVGEIEVTKVKPEVDLLAPLSRTLFARVAFDIAVKVRLVSTANGATLWTDSAVRQGTIGAIGMDDGIPVFSVRDKSAAMNDVLREIMFRVTWDFRPTRQRL
jgi:hypothetical protein